MRRFLRCLLYVYLAATLLGACVSQRLRRVRLTVAGNVSTRLTSPVKVTVALPHDYGLTAQERREGWDPLNKNQSQEVVLRDGSFEVSFPPVSYCRAEWMWEANDPPPPVWFVLHFSDAPDERYVVFRARDGLDYIVGGPNGDQWSKDQVSWRLVLGGFGRRGERKDAPWVTSPIYRTLAGGGANVKFVANITDDRGNAMTLSNQASVRRVGGPAGEVE